MTSRTAPGIAGAASVVLALSLAVAGCAAGSGPVGVRQTARPPSTPAAAGAGPYPTPSAATAAAPLPVGSVGPPKGNVPEPGDVDQGDADAVGEGALTAMWAFDTAVDRNPFDAELRTADTGWLTSAYARRLRAYRPRSVPGAQWREWTRHRAFTTVTLRPADDAAKPGDTGVEAWRQWTVTAVPHGRDGWTGEPVEVAAYVRLLRSAVAGSWRVDDVLFP